MNVLVLTPDAVGSTLIQRLLTIYMQLNQFDRPVINLHELSNGIMRYFSPEFNRELLGRSKESWGYHLSLEEITDLLRTTDHYKVARLARIHIQAREDSINDQLNFYNYLDSNFYIIACRRRNVFEYALSQTINKITKKLNVYSADEKINVFYDLYKNKITLDLEAFHGSLHTYKLYLKWCEDYFTVGSYFYYDDDIKNIESWILNLPVFQSHAKKITWKETYDIDFWDWNKCQYMYSDLGSLALEKQSNFQLLGGSNVASTVDKNISLARPRLVNLLPTAQREFLSNNHEKFKAVNTSIEKMRNLGILASTVPIKKQTLAEKIYMVKNIEQCIEIYNTWAQDNSDIASSLNIQDLMSQAEQERIEYTNTDSNTVIKILKLS
jgi:hypothetical protein